ncbi:MAG TPA: glycyl-radical enzyme activating protein, partial [Clostridia bacterium]|nr:glycyl-radical enzyme activating protein [Clostridia bacterium]
MDGLLFNVQHFSIHDGPGVRSVVFCKGCNLRCRWCHNPESIAPYPEVLYYPDRCIGCGQCFAACPSGAHRMEGGAHILDRAICRRSLRCADACYAEALVVSGQYMDAETLVQRLLEERPYFGDKGGVTFSGGESMLQIDFLEDMLVRLTREGVRCAVDTAGNVPWTYFERILPYEPMFLYDVKAADPAVHRRLTGVDNARILENLRKLSEVGARLWVRVPVIPGANVDEMPAIAELLRDIRAERVELMGY